MFVSVLKGLAPYARTQSVCTAEAFLVDNSQLKLVRFWM
jgi:hypothetical protein